MGYVPQRQQARPTGSSPGSFLWIPAASLVVALLAWLVEFL